MSSSTSQPVILRPEIVALVAYRQGRPAADDSFKLSSNENPFAPIPAVAVALAGESAINRYPDASAAALRTVIAARFEVELPQVHVGAGSVAILAQLISAAAASGDEVVYAWRSFEAYPALVAVAGATSVTVPVTADGRHDLPVMARAVTDRTRLILVCSPNNPTGSMVTATEFTEFMASVPETVLVVLDEAYIEFVTDTSAVNGQTLTGRYPNLVICRTFSKAYGLAGLRIGFAVGPERILDAARATAIPLSVTAQAQVAALVSLEHEDELLARVAQLSVLRDSVWHALVDQGWSVPRPHGNFVWLATAEQTEQAAAVFEEHGIVVRAFAGEGIRISIGEAESVDKLLRAAASLVPYLPSAHVALRLD